MFFLPAQDGDYSFSLESVKVLKRLMETEAMEREMAMEMEALVGARVAPQHHTSRQSLCSNPTLPQEMKPVCLEPQSDEVFTRFGRCLDGGIFKEMTVKIRA